MTALYGARRRADQFAAAIDNPHRDVDTELRDLVSVVRTLRSTAAEDPDATPRADFAADLRARLMAEADDVLEPGAPLALPPRHVGHRERRLVAAAATVVLIGGSTGMAAASSGALPGDPLYPVKRGIERAQTTFQVSEAGKGRHLLDQARGRLVEVRGLLADDAPAGPPRVPSALEDFTTQAEQGADLLFESFRDDRDPASVNEVREFTADALEQLETLAATAPGSSQADLREAALALRDLDLRASQLCTTCAAGAPTLDLPPVFLAAAEADRALGGVDAGNLDNSHPFVVPRSLVPAQDDRDGKNSKDGRNKGGGGSGNGGGSDAPALPGTPVLPGGGDGSGNGGDGGGDLSDPRGTLEDTVNGVGGALQDTVGQITNGLNGAVETILPDPRPSSGGLLP